VKKYEISNAAIFHEFSELFPFMNRYMQMFTGEGLDFFVSALKNVLAARENSGETSIDAASTLVDMIKKSRTDPTYKRLQIDEHVVIAQAWEFFVAGYAGARDVFDFFMYEMAMNEDIQEKVYQEIKSAGKDRTLSLEVISQLPYLTACLLETTRIHPPFIRPERLCTKEWKHEGLRIPAGTQVILMMGAVHRNPDFYPNPDTFDPSRFMPGNKEGRDPFTYLTFGQGPRGCIGQRFAMEMLKVLLVTFLIRFKFQKRADTIWEPNPGGSFILSFKPILLDVLKRE